MEQILIFSLHKTPVNVKEKLNGGRERNGLHFVDNCNTAHGTQMVYLSARYCGLINNKLHHEKALQFSSS
jgi:hypothetical protein